VLGTGEPIPVSVCAWSDGAVNGNATMAALNATCDLLVPL
jgi:hypothetical protein